mmetsp:Transcript_24985/g.32622  ORF Transcript_24985/g.32622 Transcript_24985/m.32622 type:complete len:103 (-) Transcript_24985:810-1118(-)
MNVIGSTAHAQNCWWKGRFNHQIKRLTGRQTKYTEMKTRIHTQTSQTNAIMPPTNVVNIGGKTSPKKTILGTCVRSPQQHVMIPGIRQIIHKESSAGRWNKV